MKIEIEIDQFSRALSTELGSTVAQNVLEKEFRNIIHRHEENMRKEIEQLAAAFTIHMSQDNFRGVAKITITLPDPETPKE